MSKLSGLSDSLTKHPADNSEEAAEAYRSALCSNADEIEAGPSVLPLLRVSMPSNGEGDNDLSYASAPATPLVRTRSKQPLHTRVDKADLLWWQAATAEAFIRNSVPSVPFQSEVNHAGLLHNRAPPRSSRVTASSQMKADLQNLTRIKSLHRRMARLKGKNRDMPEEADLSASDSATEDEMESLPNAPVDGTLLADSGSAVQATSTGVRRKKRRKPRPSPSDPHRVAREDLSPKANQQTLEAFCSTLLQRAGFDSKPSRLADREHGVLMTLDRCATLCPGLLD